MYIDHDKRTEDFMTIFENTQEYLTPSLIEAFEEFIEVGEEGLFFEMLLTSLYYQNATLKKSIFMLMKKYFPQMKLDERSNEMDHLEKLVIPD